MTRIRKGALTALLFAASAPAVAASYFVQPIASLSPGGFINGLEIDGDTYRFEGFNNAPTSVQSEVDLEAGTIRGNVNLLGGGSPNAGGAQGRFGEQVSFLNADGTTVNLTFSFEGFIEGPARDSNLNSLLQVVVDAYIAVFDPSVGATASNWYNLSFGAQDLTLGKARQTYDFSNPTTELDEFIGDTLEVAVDVTSGKRAFDIFANLTLNLATNNNPGPYTMDFRNTARFGIEADPGVSYTSLSGAFLDSTGVTVVPAPGALPLLGTALALGAGLARRRKRQPA